MTIGMTWLSHEACNYQSRDCHVGLSDLLAKTDGISVQLAVDYLSFKIEQNSIPLNKTVN